MVLTNADETPRIDVVASFMKATNSRVVWTLSHGSDPAAVRKATAKERPLI